MSQDKNIWYSVYSQGDYTGDEPAFLEPEQFEWAVSIEKNYDLIYKELQAYLKTNQPLQAYFNTNMVSKQGGWKTISLMAWGVNYYRKIKQFPQTMKVVQEVPGLVSVSFNLLEPNSDIKSHYGDTNAIFRCHFGLSIPGRLPEIGFKVKNEERAWEKGQLLFFCDAHRHQAWNHTNEARFILLFDVIRPEFKTKKNRVCATVLGSLSLKKVAKKFNFKWKSKKYVFLLLLFAFRYSILMTKPMYNIFAKK
jgi:aspartyl/asparaginyl beta-hydroxylase (cupin superfamily)